MPRHWQTTTFIWDYSLSSQVHALLDPVEMRRQVAHWVGLDIHSHFGTEWLTGGPVGYWYSVNHYAMTRLVHDYLRFTGDLDFLDGRWPPPDGSRRDHGRARCRTGRGRGSRLRSASGLADYGGIDNLLECVSDLRARGGQPERGQRLVPAPCGRHRGPAGPGRRRRGAARRGRPSSPHWCRRRYVPGKGIFRTAMPDGSTWWRPGTATTSPPSAPRSPTTCPRGAADEMVDFFVRELRTPSWMRALSPVRPRTPRSPCVPTTSGTAPIRRGRRTRRAVGDRARSPRGGRRVDRRTGPQHPAGTARPGALRRGGRRRRSPAVPRKIAGPVSRISSTGPARPPAPGASW